MESILTVTGAAGSYDLTTRAAVKAELDIATGDTSLDGLIDQWIKDESARIANYCNRVFQAETVSEQWRIGGRWNARHSELRLTRSPLVSVASVTEDGAALAGSDYEFDKPSALLYRLQSDARSCWTASKIVVVYVGGFATIPADIAAACIGLVKHRNYARTRDPALQSLQIEGVGLKRWWVGSSGDVGDLPPEVAGVLDRYREVRL